MATERIYVAKETTSQEILSKVSPSDLLKIEVYIGDFVLDDANIIKGNLDTYQRAIYGR